MADDDSELLRQYADNDSEAAFTKLVNRYANIVYATALRVTTDAHTANDVTQTVFCALARKAPSLISHPALSGWLHRSTRYAAINALQQRRRRTKLELDAQAMIPNESAPDPSSAQDVAPVVDELLDQLNERERRAVMLRFFEECSFADIAARLRMKEDASRICVARALEKVRASLARRGINSTTAALTVFLTTRAAIAAPPGLAAAASAAALSAPTVSAAGGLSLLVFMATKIKYVVAGLLLGGAGVVVYQEWTSRELREKTAATSLENEARLAEVQERANAIARSRLEETVAKGPPVTPPTSPIPPTADPARVVPQKPLPKIIKQWSNAGRATPAAAFETLFWAVQAGRPAEAAGLVQFEGDDAAALKSVFDSLSTSARNLFGTPAFMFIAVGLALPVDSLVSGCEIIDEVANGPDEATLHYRMAGDTRVRAMPLYQIEGAWTLRVSGLGLPDRQAMWKEMAQSLADDIERRRANDDGSNGKN